MIPQNKRQLNINLRKTMALWEFTKGAAKLKLISLNINITYIHSRMIFLNSVR